MNRSSSNSQKWYGITPPVSTRPAEKSELNETDKLIEALEKYQQFETPEEAHKR
jgi:poly(A) polymerase Pap1